MTSAAEVPENGVGKTLDMLGLCQVITSAHKARTWLATDYSILKGPYKSPDKVKLILARRAILADAWALRVAGPYRLHAGDDGSYLHSPHVAREFVQPTQLAFEIRAVLSFDAPIPVYSKAGQGFVELNEAIRSKSCTGPMAAQAAVHLLARYILDPVVGDAAVRNMLVVLAPEPYVVGIDFEDNRTGDAAKRAQEQRDGLEACLTGGKRWSRSNWDVIARGLARRADMERFLRRVDASWDRVESAVREHKCSAVCSLDRMRERAAFVRRALETLWTRAEAPTPVPPAEHGLMRYSYRQAVSANGHAKDVLLSALQKYIRRNKLDKAWYAAVELDKFSQLPEAKALVTNAINRLWVSAGEEVGLASPRLAQAFGAAYRQWIEARPRGYADVSRREALLRMVRMLVRAPKIRMISDIKAAFFTPGAMQLALQDAELRKMYPDDAGETLDSLAAAYWKRVALQDRQRAAAYVHSSEPEVMRRAAAGMLFAARTKSDDGFYWLGQLAQITIDGCEAEPRPASFTRVRNNNPMRLALQIFVAAADSENEEAQRTVKSCVALYKHFGLKLGGIKKSHRDWCVFVLWPALYVFRTVVYAIFPPEASPLEPAEVEAIYARNDTKREFDDYVFDQHTAEGRRRGRGPKHFAEHGAKVNREALPLRNPLYRTLYTRWKQVQQDKKRKR